MFEYLALTLAIVPIVLGFAAQYWVGRAFDRALTITAAAGIAGAAAAPRLLEAAGCADVGVETIEETLGDHYDPRARTVRMSKVVASSRSVGALAVVAHEIGHAAQHHEGDRAFRLQRRIVPVASFCSYAWIVAVVAGLMLESAGLVAGAIALFACIAAFHVATLPVELGASRRALALLTADNLLLEREVPAARRVLQAAAATYLVAALVAIAELARIVIEIWLSSDE